MLAAEIRSRPARPPRSPARQETASRASRTAPPSTAPARDRRPATAGTPRSTPPTASTDHRAQGRPPPARADRSATTSIRARPPPRTRPSTRCASTNAAMTSPSSCSTARSSATIQRPNTPRNRSSCSTVPERVPALQQPHAIPLHERTQPPRLQTRLRHRHRLLVEAAASTIEMAQSDDGTMPIRLPASPRETQPDQDTTHPREIGLGIVALSAQRRLSGYPDSRPSLGSSASWRR